MNLSRQQSPGGATSFIVAAEGATEDGRRTAAEAGVAVRTAFVNWDTDGGDVRRQSLLSTQNGESMNF